jgi:hypothetical protein
MEVRKSIGNYKLSTFMYIVIAHCNSCLVLNNSWKDELENLKAYIDTVKFLKI